MWVKCGSNVGQMLVSLGSNDIHAITIAITIAISSNMSITIVVAIAISAKPPPSTSHTSHYHKET